MTTTEQREAQAERIRQHAEAERIRWQAELDNRMQAYLLCLL